MNDAEAQNNSILDIDCSHTLGREKSMIDSPSWVVTYGVTESLIKKFNVKNIVEIGVCRGHHSAHLLEAIPELHVYSVDPWGLYFDEYNNMYEYHTLAEDEKIYNQARQLLTPFGSRSTILRMTSRRAAASIKDPVDMVYLDGDHSYEGYKDDLCVWWNKVRPGGIFSGRDYNHPSHPGVKIAVDEFLNNFNGIKINLEAGMVWWLIKPTITDAKASTNNGLTTIKLKPPLFWRLKKTAKRFFIIARVKIKSSVKKIPGIKFIYLVIKINILNYRIKPYYNRLRIKIFTILFNFFNNKEKKIFKKNYLFFKKNYLEKKTNLNEKSSYFLIPAWSEYAKKIEAYFINNFPLNFLSNPVLRNTMFINSKWEKIQLKFLESRYEKNKLKKILLENKFGYPAISSCQYRTSPNSIHHLNHLVLFEEKTGCILSNITNIVEWGGGYGNMAKIFLKINPNVTYSIIDLPIFIFIQAIYLSSIFGREKINVITEINKKIKNNCINLITLNEELLKSIDFYQPDIFISTWALSESNDFSQNFIEKLDYFKSKYLLLAHQATSPTMPFASNILNKINKYDILYPQKIDYIKGENSYLFAKLKK